MVADGRIDQLNARLAQRGFSPVLTLGMAPAQNQARFAWLIERGIAALSSHAESKPISTNVGFCLLESSRINACAIKVDGEFFVGVNAAFDLSLKKIFVALLADGGIAKKFGIIFNEKYLKDSNEELSFIDRCQFVDLSQIDPDIDEIAVIMTTICFDFICYHEYAHIMSGHLNYLTNDANVFCMSEAHDELENDDEAYSRRVLEHDADAFGAVQSFGNSLKTNIWDKTELTKVLFEDWSKRFQASFIAIFTLFIVLDKLGSSNNVSKSTHPPLAWRSMFALGSLMESACRSSGKTYADYTRDITQPAFDSVANFFLKGGEHDLYFKSLREWYAGGHFDAISDRWSKLVPDLNRLKISPTFILASDLAELK